MSSTVGYPNEQNENVEANELQFSPTLLGQSSQLTASQMEELFMLDGCNNTVINQDDDFIYNTPEDLLGFNCNNDIDQFINWSELEELQNNLIMNPYLYNEIIESNSHDIFDSYNPFIGQSSAYEDPTSLGGNLLLTQPLSEVTQNVIENQQQLSLPSNWCDLSILSDAQQQQFISINNFSSKLSEQNQQNNHISSENYYTDFQLL